MAMINAKTIRNALKTFAKENGREPNFEEFKKVVTGKSDKKKPTKNVEEKK